MNVPKWLEIARSEVGVHEVKGGESPRILEYHASCTLKAKEDEIPWCSAFVNWCMEKVGVKGTDSAAAISWKDWGVSLTEPQVGCVVVIRAKSKGPDSSTGSSSGNHVAFFEKIEDNRIYLMGGNQSDSVKLSSFGLGSYEVVAYRWPKEG